MLKLGRVFNYLYMFIDTHTQQTFNWGRGNYTRDVYHELPFLKNQQSKIVVISMFIIGLKSGKFISIFPKKPPPPPPERYLLTLHSTI